MRRREAYPLMLLLSIFLSFFSFFQFFFFSDPSGRPGGGPTVAFPRPDLGEVGHFGPACWGSWLADLGIGADASYCPKCPGVRRVPRAAALWQEARPGGCHWQLASCLARLVRTARMHCVACRGIRNSEERVVLPKGCRPRLGELPLSFRHVRWRRRWALMGTQPSWAPPGRRRTPPGGGGVASSRGPLALERGAKL